MLRLKSLLLTAVIGIAPNALLLSSVTRAEILFEGYAKVLSGNQPIGFYVQRYEFDPKKKEFLSINLIRLGAAGGNLTESLKARANEKFEPIAYQYTSTSDSATKTIDAKFEKGTLKAVITSGGKGVTHTRKLPKGVFLSSFLQYLMLQNGYSIGKKFNYSAISEEDAEVFPGEALIKQDLKIKDISGFKILNEFKNAQFVSFVSVKGEVLATVSPAQSISTELVANAHEATKGFSLPEKPLRLLFGSIPLGKKNVLNEKPKLENITGPTIAVPNVNPAGPSGFGAQLQSEGESKDTSSSPRPMSPPPVDSKGVAQEPSQLEQ